MKRISADVTGRAKSLIISLIDQVEQRNFLFCENKALQVRWIEYKQPIKSRLDRHKLLVKADLATLARLAGTNVSKDDIRYVLYLLRDSFALLDDLRFTQQGAKEWLFLLTLNSRDRDVVESHLEGLFNQNQSLASAS